MDGADPEGTPSICGVSHGLLHHNPGRGPVLEEASANLEPEKPVVSEYLTAQAGTSSPGSPLTGNTGRWSLGNLAGIAFHSSRKEPSLNNSSCLNDVMSGCFIRKVKWLIMSTQI